jgi:hypothetical protein
MTPEIIDDENPFSVQFPVMVSLNVLGALEVVLNETPDPTSLAILRIWLWRAWEQSNAVGQELAV